MADNESKSLEENRMKHSFSIEMGSKNNVHKISLSSETNDAVIFEGELGELVSIMLVEDILLQITGENGILRLYIENNDLIKGLNLKPT